MAQSIDHLRPALVNAGVPSGAIERLEAAAADLPSLVTICATARRNYPIDLLGVATHLDQHSQILVAKVMRTLVRLLGIDPPTDDVLTIEGFDKDIQDDDDTGADEKSKSFADLVHAIRLLRASGAGLVISDFLETHLEPPPEPVGPGGGHLDEEMAEWQEKLWEDKPWRDS